MDWVQFGIFIITFVGLFTWNRVDARTDARHMDAKLSALNQSTDAKITSMSLQTTSMIQSIQNEMKDFHGRLERQDAEFKIRLLSIEQEKIQKNQKE